MAAKTHSELRRGLISALMASLSGNLLASILMGVAVIVLPKFVPMETYGTWQAYVLYTTYLGYLTFGLAEGYYVRHSGEEIRHINKTEVTGQLAVTVLLLLVVLVPSAVLVKMFSDTSTFLIVGWAMLTTMLYVPRVYLCYVFQSVNRMWVFARAFIIERMVFLLLACVAVVSHNVEAWLLLLCDTIGRLMGLLFTLWKARKHLLGRIQRSQIDTHRLGQTFKAGLSLNLAALAAVLLTAIPRFAVERFESVDVFGQVAFVFSLVALFQTVASAVSNAILPSLRRAGHDRYNALYARSSNYLGLLTVALTPLVGVMVLFVRWWLPTLTMLPALVLVIFPILYFESRSRIVSTPFLQAIRDEKYIAGANVIPLLLCLLGVSYAVWQGLSVMLMVVCIPVAVALRAFLLAARTDQKFAGRSLPQVFCECLLSLAMVMIALNTEDQRWWAVLIVVWLAVMGVETLGIRRGQGKGKGASDAHN